MAVSDIGFPVRLVVVEGVLPCCTWAINILPAGSATNWPIHPSVKQWKTEPFVKLDKIREKLEWEPGFLNGHAWKPGGMHWKTFHRLYAEHDTLVNQVMSAYIAKFERF